MFERMKSERAHWLAQISVEGCDRDRGEEIGALAADLAIVTLQLALPTSWNTRGGCPGSIHVVVESTARRSLERPRRTAVVTALTVGNA